MRGVAGNASAVVVDNNVRRALPRPQLQELIGLLLILHDGDAQFAPMNCASSAGEVSG